MCVSYHNMSTAAPATARHVGEFVCNGLVLGLPRTRYAVVQATPSGEAQFLYFRSEADARELGGIRTPSLPIWNQEFSTT